MENWAVYQLELYQVKENRMEECKGRGKLQQSKWRRKLRGKQE